MFFATSMACMRMLTLPNSSILLSSHGRHFLAVAVGVVVVGMHLGPRQLQSPSNTTTGSSRRRVPFVDGFCDGSMVEGEGKVSCARSPGPRRLEQLLFPARSTVVIGAVPAE